MTVYKVKLIDQSGLNQIIEVPENEYILDVAQSVGIRLPSGCKQGNCSACVAKVISGKIDQSEQSFLSIQEIAAGYTITCVASPLSDCTLKTHQEQVLYKSSLYLS